MYDEETGTTWFTDTPRSVIYGFNVKEGQKSLKRLEVGEPVGCLALIDGVRIYYAATARKLVFFFQDRERGNGWTDVTMGFFHGRLFGGI